ncbi:hypothetical protein N7535_005433 [Penicillium sp. DV-2018c]|nr:hypothetical protein N7461_009012 [Penicillium sp. DV-2018c]KAJ5571773.1 hypothetical protein N7535_005433 [Penicillium sp. DV-2018c]
MVTDRYIEETDEATIVRPHRILGSGSVGILDRLQPCTLTAYPSAGATALGKVSSCKGTLPLTMHWRMHLEGSDVGTLVCKTQYRTLVEGSEHGC